MNDISVVDKKAVESEAPRLLLFGCCNPFELLSSFAKCLAISTDEPSRSGVFSC